MTSWMVLSCAAEKTPCPIRLAGTWKQYSAKAISQLIKMTKNSGFSLNLRWPYHAKVMKRFEIVSSNIVFI